MSKNKTVVRTCQACGAPDSAWSDDVRLECGVTWGRIPPDVILTQKEKRLDDCMRELHLSVSDCKDARRFVQSLQERLRELLAVIDGYVGKESKR